MQTGTPGIARISARATGISDDLLGASRCQFGVLWGPVRYVRLAQYDVLRAEAGVAASALTVLGLLFNLLAGPQQQGWYHPGIEGQPSSDRNPDRNGYSLSGSLPLTWMGDSQHFLSQGGVTA